MVLACLVIFLLAGIAILNFTTTVAHTTSSFAASQTSLREIDGRLERAVNWYRSNSSAVNTPCVGSLLVPPSESTAPYSLACSSTSVSTTQRTTTIELFAGSSVVGRAGIRVYDLNNNGIIAGIAMDVCDWQLGSQVETGIVSC